MEPSQNVPKAPIHHAKANVYQTSPSLGKILVPFIVIILIIVIVHAALTSPKGNSVSVAPTATPIPSVTPASAALPAPSPAEAVQQKTIKAGMDSDIFTAYSLNLSTGWISTHESNVDAKTDDVTLTKEVANVVYTLVISQAAGGAGSCVYPGEPSQQMSQTFTSYVGIPGITHQFRRGTTDGKTHTVCEKKIDSYAFPTTFGYITYKTPAKADPAILNEMDAMVASLSK